MRLSFPRRYCDERIDLEDFINVDTDVFNVENIIDPKILKVWRKLINNQNGEEWEDDEEDNEFKPTRGELSKAFITIRNGFQNIDNIPDNIFAAINKCEQFLTNKCIFNTLNKMQLHRILIIYNLSK